jgi:hypothetical protein
MLEELETEANKIDSSRLTLLTTQELQTLLAYAYWKDGCDDKEFLTMIKDNTEGSSSQEMTNILHQQFGYSL